MKKKAGLLLSFAMASSVLLTACGNTNEDAESNNNGESGDITIGLVTDIGGINDKSFNQTTWEGIAKFGAEHGLEQGTDYQYLVSEQDADYEPNLTKFAEENFDLIFAPGFLLSSPLTSVAEQFPDNNFVMIDSVVELDNVASVTFEEHVGSFLAGVAAALTTETDTIGFIGGVDSAHINRFEVGFVQGAKTVNPDIEVITSYVGDFNSADRGATLAAMMYSSGADIIYHASGAAGNGIFTEAKNRVANGDRVWVIGVDRDQHDEGLPENVTLTSMLKRVDVAAYDIATKTLEGNFPGGQTIEYGLAEDGVGLAEGNLSEDVLEQVEEYKQRILNGEIEVISTREEMFEMFPEMQ